MQCIIHKLSKAAAIAQPVERILGKDEVASSNLASSSNKTPKPSGFGVSFLLRPDLNHQMQQFGELLLAASSMAATP